MLRNRVFPALLAAAGLLSACQGADEGAPAAEASAPAAPGPALPRAEPPIGREALLTAVMRAGSDFALGRDDRERQRQLDGKRFEVALRFGCDDTASTTRSSSFDAEARVLRVSVSPEISEETPIAAALLNEGVEAVEGFWIDRPWLLEAACPARPAPLPEPSPTGSADAAQEEADVAPAAAAPAVMERPRLAIAQFFTAEDSRTGRRGDRAYEATVQLAEGESPSTEGYDLVLSGRFVATPAGKVIACSGPTGTAPTCVVSARFDHVTVRRPDGSSVADWSRS